MAIVKVERNSKKTFFGGKGSLIPFRPRTTKPSPENSVSATALQKEHNQIAQEAIEQMGSQSEKTEPSSSSATPSEKDSTD